MSYYAVTYSKSLSHHGIKGQSWGKRRFQYEDGSLTDAGRQRYGVGERIKSTVSNLHSRITGTKAYAKVRAVKDKKESQRKKAWLTDDVKSRSWNKRLGRKINASEDVRLARGKKLSDKGRTRAGAVARGAARDVGIKVGSDILKAYVGLKVASITRDQKSVDLAKKIVDSAGTLARVSNAVRTYQDVADITTYKRSK